MYVTVHAVASSLLLAALGTSVCPPGCASCVRRAVVWTVPDRASITRPGTTTSSPQGHSVVSVCCPLQLSHACLALRLCGHALGVSLAGTRPCCRLQFFLNRIAGRVQHGERLQLRCPEEC